jgi:hypothetical protein
MSIDRPVRNSMSGDWVHMDPPGSIRTHAESNTSHLSRVHLTELVFGISI